MKTRTTVEHLIDSGERDIDSVIRDVEHLLGCLRLHKESGHAKATVGTAGSIAAKVSVAEETAPPQGPATATDATVTPETQAE